MCVLTLAGAEKKKTAVPRCFEAAVAYIQLKLRRKTVADKTNFLIQCSTAYLINLSCFIDKKTLEFNLRKARIFYSCCLCFFAKVFFEV